MDVSRRAHRVYTHIKKNGPRTRLLLHRTCTLVWHVPSYRLAKMVVKLTFVATRGVGLSLAWPDPTLPFIRDKLALGHWTYYWFLSLSFFLCAHNLRSTSSKLQKLERKSCFLLYSWVTFSRSRASSLRNVRNTYIHILKLEWLHFHELHFWLLAKRDSGLLFLGIPTYAVHTSAASQKITLCHA